jgi:hypothetical protein
MCHSTFTACLLLRLHSVAVFVGCTWGCILAAMKCSMHDGMYFARTCMPIFPAQWLRSENSSCEAGCVGVCVCGWVAGWLGGSRAGKIRSKVLPRQVPNSSSTGPSPSAVRCARSTRNRFLLVLKGGRFGSGAVSFFFLIGRFGRGAVYFPS